MSATLTTCIERAADIYRGHAEVLAAIWQEINTALVASDTPTLAWHQIFIPALEGMRGAADNHSRASLFAGCEPNVSAMDAELAALVSQ